MTNLPRPVVPKMVLLDLPFNSIIKPNLALSLLRQVALRNGFPCELRYLSAEFASRIGYALYRTIGVLLPAEHLLGDFVFAPAVRGSDGLLEEYARLLDQARSRRQFRLGRAVPGWLRQVLPELCEAARDFCAGAADALLAEGFNVFGFSLMFQCMPSLALAKAIKERCPDSCIVFGGANCEGSMGRTIHETYPWVDYVCRGEGERVLPALLGALAGRAGAVADIQGLVWRDGGRTVCNGSAAPRTDDLDALPLPEYDDWLAQLRRQNLPVPEEDLQLPVETSRGCWYGEKQHCVFCGLNGESLTYRKKSPDRILGELTHLVRYGVANVFAVDLIFPHQYFESLLPRLREAGLGLRLFYEVKANLTRAQLALLAGAGVRRIQPGIESLSTSVLRRMRKGVAAYQNLRLLKWAAELGLDVEWIWLYGFPGEDPAEYHRMAALVPRLTHLRPPSTGCCRVRVDRFSPMHFDADGQGVTGMRPAPAYQVVFGLDGQRTGDLAYHFDFDQDFAEGYAGALSAAVLDWLGLVGEASFVAVPDGPVLRLYDRRPGARTSEANLRDFERDVYEACDAGATLSELDRRFPGREARLRRALAEQEELGWLVHVDERYLSLATRDESVAGMAPAEILGAVAHVRHRAQMLAFWKSLVRSLDLPAGVTPRGTPPAARPAAAR